MGAPKYDEDFKRSVVAANKDIFYDQGEDQTFAAFDKSPQSP